MVITMIQYIYRDAGYIRSLRENLLVIKDVLLAENNSSKVGPEIMDSINYLEREKENLPKFYREEIEKVINEAKNRLTIQEGF
jgi:hypothetical protein